MTAPAPSGSYVEVNEALVFAARQGADWWARYLCHQHPRRITYLTASIGGCRIAVACDNPEDASWLAQHMIEFGGLSAKTVLVRRTACPKGAP